MAPPSGQLGGVASAPRNPAFSVPRPRLEAVLDGLGPGGVGLIVASAGSGKSVLMGQWMRSSARPSCYVPVTSAHDDPVVFARALVTGVGSVAPGFDTGIADLVGGAGGAMGPAFLSSFLVALENLDGEIDVLLDDLHRLTNGAIGDDLDQMIGRLPANARVVVGARWDPLLRLHHHRLDGRLAEIRGVDLAFDADESRVLVQAVSGRSVTEQQAKALVTRTDGWVAGLQLAGISLQRAGDVDGFISAFAGSNRLVADYLAQEVIDDLEPDVRRFLLQTSVLDWLSVDLCNAVTGGTDADAMLAVLDRRSLFLMPADGNGERLRYHHLFADLLVYRLRAGDPGEEAALRRRAASWLLREGHVAEAVEQLLAAGDPARVVEVIVDRGQQFFEREEAATLVRWLTAARGQDPDLPAALGLHLLAAHVAAHQTGAAIETYRRLRRRDDLTAGETAAAAALYAGLGLDDLPTSEVRKASAEALTLLGAIDDDGDIDVLGLGGRDTTEFIAETIAAVALLHDGEMAGAAERFRASLDLPGAQYRVWKIHALGGLALTRALQGYCTEAGSLAEAAVDLADAGGVAHHICVTYAHLALTFVALDRRDREAATYHVHEADTRAQRTGRASFLAFVRLLRIEHIAWGSGPAHALAEIRASVPGAFEPAIVAELRRAQELRLLIAEGKLVAARALLESGPTAGPSLQEVDLALASGDVPAARRALAGRNDSPSDPRSSVELLLRTTAVLLAEGHAEQAAAALQDALDRAEPESLRRPFLDQSAAMRLLRTEARRASQTFARSILDVAASSGARSDAQRRLVEPLTDREREVLDYLPTRLTNSEIAAALFVSVNTLKSHLRHIYTKLDAVDRDHAVARASDLGLL